MNTIINTKLKKYVERNILPEYKKNDLGHNINHINYVIKRSKNFAKNIDDVNFDIVYTVASYHDLAHHIDAKNHEKLSSDILFNDKNLLRFFTLDEMYIMKDAVYDHRASMSGEPRNIYGKILSSADRNVDIDDVLRRCYQYRIKNYPDSTNEEIINDSKEHLINKFGLNGYANGKMYFKDLEYLEFLNEVRTLCDDERKFKERFSEINNLSGTE